MNGVSGSSLHHQPAPPWDRTFSQGLVGVTHDVEPTVEPKRSLWQSYQQWVQTNQTNLWIIDELLSRLLVWTPSLSSSSIESKRWRQIGFGLLDFHRLLVEVALTTSNEPARQQQSGWFGTSVAVPAEDSSSSFVPSAQAIRLGLTVLHSFLPMALELARPSDAALTLRRPAQVRCFVERLRFVFRLTLLIKYWRRVWMHTRATDSTPRVGSTSGGSSRVLRSVTVLPGLLLRGGLYHAPAGIPLDHEQARLERANYVGRRTGRRLVPTTPRLTHATTAAAPPLQTNATLQFIRLVLGELLYILRPLVQAEGHARTLPPTDPSVWQHPTLPIWLCCLVMDLISLVSLRGNTLSISTAPAVAATRTGTMASMVGLLRRVWLVRDDNPVTATELQRRQYRLLLYLLRTPVWEHGTERTLRTCTDALSRVPLLGGLVNHYLWDWIYYWQLYRAEEG